MERIVVESKIAEQIKKMPKGNILFVEDFLDYGNGESVKKALFRLKQKGMLVSLAHGIYLYPRTDKELGVLFPGTDNIAKAIARRDKARIATTGIQALNLLGLSTQVPLRIVYLTDGASRSVKIGKSEIRFMKTSPKNLAARGELSSLAIQALKVLGPDNINDKIVTRVKTVLQNENREHLVHDAKLAPAWIHKILMTATHEHKLADTLQTRKNKST